MHSTDDHDIYRIYMPYMLARELPETLKSFFRVCKLIAYLERYAMSLQTRKNDFGVSGSSLASIFEGLREKMLILGGLQGHLLKCCILKINFLHEKIIFFALDFFPVKVWLCSVRK